MKLKVGECACTKRGRIYCRTQKGYRFLLGVKGRCRPKHKGRKIPKSESESLLRHKKYQIF